MKTKEDVREVVIVTTVTIVTRTPTTRFHYHGMSEQQIIDFENGQEADVLLEEFVDDVQGTPTDQIKIERTVTIEDKK